MCPFNERFGITFVQRLPQGARRWGSNAIEATDAGLTAISIALYVVETYLSEVEEASTIWLAEVLTSASLFCFYVYRIYSSKAPLELAVTPGFSNCILSYHIATIPSHPIRSHLIGSRPTRPHPIWSHPIWTQTIRFHPIRSHPIRSHPVP